jgi:hypothetical protein
MAGASIITPRGAPDGGISRASERVALACRALSAAATDLDVARRRDGIAVDEAAHALAAETERVCELAEQLGRLAEQLGVLARVG